MRAFRRKGRNLGEKCSIFGESREGEKKYLGGRKN